MESNKMQAHAVGYLLTVIMQARELRISSRTKEYTPRYSMLKTHPDLEKRTTITLSIATTWDWNSITTSKYSQCKSFILLLSIRSSNTPYTVAVEQITVFGDIYPYFDWVEYAAYNGQRAMGEQTLWLLDDHGKSENLHDSTAQIIEQRYMYLNFFSSDHFYRLVLTNTSIAVNPLNVNVPIYYLHHHEYENRTVYHKFVDFQAVEPPETEFEIPEFCQQEFKEKRKEIKQKPKSRRAWTVLHDAECWQCMFRY